MESTKNQKPVIIDLHCEHADIYIGYVPQANVTYYYGGTRLVAPDCSEQEVQRQLVRLMTEESALKNRLINHVFSLHEMVQENLPSGVAGSLVGGGRCLIRPRTASAHDILQDPSNPAFTETIDGIFSLIGGKLNELQGLVKLTPDFGRFGDCSDLLHKYTEHVLGVGCDLGGCGGKSSYSTSGIIGGMHAAGLLLDKKRPVTVIGSAGALGSEIVDYLLSERFSDIAVCDIAYGEDTAPHPHLLKKLPAQLGIFTSEALSRGGVIIAATWGNELENSKLDAIPAGTDLVLAHNLCLPEGARGRELASQIEARGITALPGALLTLGGALTSRLEWFHRASGTNVLFDKPLAHRVAQRAVEMLTRRTLDLASNSRITVFEAMQLVG